MANTIYPKLTREEYYAWIAKLKAEGDERSVGVAFVQDHTLAVGDFELEAICDGPAASALILERYVS